MSLFSTSSYMKWSYPFGIQLASLEQERHVAHVGILCDMNEWL